MNIEKLIILLIHLFILFLIERSNSTTCDSNACGSTGYCLESSSPPACDQCACSINYTSTCCNAPYDCNSPDHMKLFIHSSAVPYQTLGPGSKQTYANISSTPCGDGNVICPWKTDDPDWDYTYDRDAYDITFQCNNLCIKDNAGDFWQTNDPTFNRVRVRPYYSGASVCESGWTYFEKTKSCYWVGSDANFSIANDACIQMGSNLASIHSVEENTFLVELSQIGTYYAFREQLPWIGGILDDPIACTYKWADGTPFDYANFYVNQPDCGRGSSRPESCMQLYTDQTNLSPPAKFFWNDVPCYMVARAYICKKPSQIVQPTTAYGCESEWTYLEETQSCYKKGYNANFADAESACTALGSKLTSIHSLEENTFLVDFAQISDDDSCNNCDGLFPYIGAVIDDPIACTYKWSDGTPFDYANWYTNEPSCSGEACAFLFTSHRDNFNPPAKGMWGDGICTQVARVYICKKPAFSSFYVFQEFVQSLPAGDYSKGLVRMRDGQLTPLRGQDPNNDGINEPITSPNHGYITARAISCAGCTFDTENCDMYPHTTTYCGGLYCDNGGACVLETHSPPTNPSCQCQNIWRGTTCSDFDPCGYFQNDPITMCLNGGTCYSNSSFFPDKICVCPVGFCGDRCERTGLGCANGVRKAMTEPNFNRDYLPFILANVPIEEKSNMSWNVDDLCVWASFERTEIDLNKDLTKWYENSMGNCFTFNHENSSKIAKLRYTGEFGGFKAQMKINQAEYFGWVYTASLLLFFHRKDEAIMGESPSYQIAPGEEANFLVERKTFTRLGSPYNKCIKKKSEVKSYYNPGSAYTVDSCFRSCYQDYVFTTCGCMDPRYYKPNDVYECDIYRRECVDNITAKRGEPSTWPECSCPPPCSEYIFDVTWTKTIFRSKPLQCQTNDSGVCEANFRKNTAAFSIQVPKLMHRVFVETPKKSVNNILTDLCNLTGLMLGLSVISIFEFIYLVIRICYVMITNKSAVHEKEEEKDEKENNLSAI